MAELYRINKSTLEDLADTVRTATGQTGPISFDQIEEVAKQSIIVSNGGTSGGGGGSVGTCTVTITVDPSLGRLFQYCFSSLVDDTITTTYTEGMSTVTLSNVICGSALVIEVRSEAIEGAGNVTNGGTYLGYTVYTYYFKAPSESNATTEFTIYDADV